MTIRPSKVVLALLLASCSTQGAFERHGLPEVAWPPAEPRVRLQRIISTRRDLGKGFFLRLLTGQGDPGLFRRPHGIAWQGDDLLVTDPGAARVIRIDARGRTKVTAFELFQSPIGVAACSQGVVVSDSRRGRVALLRPDLTLARWLAEDLERPTGLACHDSRIIVVETGHHRVISIDPRQGPGRSAATNTLVARRGSQRGQLNFPTALALGLGSMWVADTLNFRLQRFDPDSGDFQDAFGRLGNAAGEMPRLKGVAIDAAARVWVTDAYLDQIALYRADGTFLMSIGGRGTRPGEFSFPAGIAAHPDGRIAVVDSFNRRIQIFQQQRPVDASGA